MARAHSMDELKALQGRFFLMDEVFASIGAYKARPTDIIISPFAKCGTTWLQQAFHTLRTGGDMDFEDISGVVPWIETAGGLKVDLEALQKAEPRGFKSHLTYDFIPKGARYVVSLRDPKDALVSYYRFFENWLFEAGTISITEFAEPWLADVDGPRSYWNHLLSWWAQRDNPDVMLVTYEHMTAAPRESLIRLARFAGIAADEALINLALERSSIDYMLAHKDRFADPMMRRLSVERCGVPADSDSAKVRKGGCGGHVHELTPAISAEIDRLWTERVAPVTGFADYAALDAALRARAATA